MLRPDDIAARLELLERALASMAPAALGSPCKPVGLPTGGSLLDAKGIRQRSKSYGVDTFVRGHRVTRGGFASRAAAERWLYELRADKQALEAFLVGRYAAPTVRAVIESYMSGKGGTCKSADRHRQMQVHLLTEKHGLAGLDASLVRQRNVDAYAAARVSAGAAPKTVHNELSMLRTALRYAWIDEQLAQPPRFVLRQPRCERSRIASPEEAARLMEGSEWDLRRVVAAAWSLGLRRGEMIAARWEHVNELTRVLTLTASITKTARERAVHIPPRLWALLREEPRHPELVWPHQARHAHGPRAWMEPWTPRSLRRAWDNACSRAGLTDLHLHDLRRSMASHAQTLGHSLAAVRGAGGWEPGGALERHYSHAGPAQVAAIGEELERMVLRG